jgi:hypothetical protein
MNCEPIGNRRFEQEGFDARGFQAHDDGRQRISTSRPIFASASSRCPPL